MRVKIVKAGKPTYWYADKIGSDYEVYGLDNSISEDAYDTASAVADGCFGSIDACDCEVIE